MSAALVRRGLELISADASAGPKAKKKKPQQKKIKSGVSKRASKAPPAGHYKATAKDQCMRNALEEASRGEQHSQKHTALTLQYFLQSGSTSSTDQTGKILHHNSGRQSKNSARTPAPKPPEQQTVFTEEEFQQFQREYFGRMVEEQ